MQLDPLMLTEDVEEDSVAVLDEASMVSEGKLSKPGFIKAIALWYSLCDEREVKRKQEEASACCILC